MKAKGVPEILKIPPKLEPIVSKFSDFRYFLLEGGRGSGKTHSIARLISYVAEKRKVRVFCGRETQNTIEESVYTVFKDLIEHHNLDFRVLRDRIVHRTTESKIRFKGFREQGAINIKGLEGVDILWIDEAQAITKNTLDVIIPTIRDNRARVFFSMNRYLVNDPIFQEFRDRPDCLHIHIDYDENPFCPEALRNEAEKCKRENPDDYRHIWKGEPLADADNYLFGEQELSGMLNREFPYDASLYHAKLLGCDVARFGENYSSAVTLKQCGPDHWGEDSVERWQKHDTMHTTGRFIDIAAAQDPEYVVVDGDGLGGPVCDRMRELRKPVVEFHGGLPYEGDPGRYKNRRTHGYLTLKAMSEQGRIRVKSPFIVEQLRQIKYRYDSTGRKYILPKEQLIEEARRRGIKFNSPDDADGLMMAVTMIETVKREQAAAYVSRHSKDRRGRVQAYASESRLI